MLYPYLVIGIVLVIIDMMIGTVWVLAAGIGALVMALLMAIFPEMPVISQISSVVALSIILPILVKKYGIKKQLAQDASINNPAQSKVGMACTPLADFKDGQGRVMLGGTSWTAFSSDGENYVEGQKLTVVQVTPDCTLEVTELSIIGSTNQKVFMRLDDK